MRKLYIIFIFLIAGSKLAAQISTEALQEWEDRKYSMFIHWGIYSELGGVWEGKNISRGLSEQIQAHAGIYSDTYAQVASRFNPVKWNADSVALLAKRAGMRSIVITSKHHDGFCMFHSQYTDFNIVDATPFQRDVLAELSRACANHGLKFGLYFSLIDWHYPQASPISSHNSDLITPEHFELNKKQITELLTRYGPVSELWFDMGSHTFEQSLEMRRLVHSLQPDCMIGSRLGNDMSDFTVMSDNQEPDYIIGTPWQSPASFFHETWGYRSWQQRGSEAEKTDEKLTSLIRVCSRGGNYLLNIGLRGDGSVVEFERDVLLNIGRWLSRNGESIYGASPDPFHVPFEWGAITSRNNRLYLHVIAMPDHGKIMLPGLSGKITSAHILDSGTPCTFYSNNTGTTIALPPNIVPTKKIIVIAVEFKENFTVPPINTIRMTENLMLDQHNAFKYYSNSGIDYNTRFRSTIREEWTIIPSRSAEYTPTLHYTDAEKDRTISLMLDGKHAEVTLNGGTEKMLRGTDGIVWSPIYLLGSLPSGIDGLHGDATLIDITQPWGRSGKMWVQTEWKNNEIHTATGGLTQAWYMLQEITSPDDRQIIVQITSSDAVATLLNGRTIARHNNPYRKEYLQDVLLLDLKKGKNQLLVKCFCNFSKRTYMGIGTTNVAQRIYIKHLESVNLRRAKYFPVSWKLANPVTPHETLKLYNLRLTFER